MAKKAKRASGKRSGEKTAAVRTYLQSNPSDGPKIVVSALKEQGVTVSAQLVSNMRSQLKKAGLITGGAARAGRPPKVLKAAKSSGMFAGLMEAKKLIDAAGSIQAAREALGIVEQIRS